VRVAKPRDGCDSAFGPPAVRAQRTEHGLRLIGVDELDDRGVAQVDTPDGVLAVGISNGSPFAVSNVCRHQFAKLGNGRVADNGCLQCPWHRAWFDVRSGEMVRGPQGRIFGVPPYSRMIQGYTNAAFKLDSHPVEERDGAIYLTEG